MAVLTFEETAVVRIYRNQTRGKTIAAMRKTREYVDPEIRGVLDSSIKKVETMTDTEFASLDLSTPFDAEEEAIAE